MARGTANNEPVVSQARTPEYDEGYDRIFGRDRQPQRGRWVWDAEQGKLVRAEDYVPPQHALEAPVMVDRFYEGLKATDGTDIGSRRKHRQYMKDNNLTTMDDFSDAYYAKQKAAKRREYVKNRRNVIDRAIYEKFKP